MIGAVALSCLTGFALAIYKFKGNLLVFFMFVAGNFVPFQILAMPVRDLTLSLGMYNTIMGLVLFHIAFQTGFCTLFMRNFIKGLPFALIESARVEGVNEWRIFWHIVLPLMRPAIAALSVLIFTFIWNDYFWATVMAQSADVRAGDGRHERAQRPVEGCLGADRRGLHRRRPAAGRHVLPDAEALHRRPDARGDQGMSKLVTISGGHLSLALLLPERGMPEIVAFGSFAEDAETLVASRQPRSTAWTSRSPSAVLLPTGGMGFFGWPAIAGHRNGRDFIQQFHDWTADTRLTSA